MKTYSENCGYLARIYIFHRKKSAGRNSTYMIYHDTGIIDLSCTNYINVRLSRLENTIGNQFLFYNCILTKETNRSGTTSATVEVRWKILDIPRWTSGDFPSIVKTEDITSLSSDCLNASEWFSTPSSISTCDPLHEPIDSAISETASSRADIEFLSHKGWVTCNKNLNINKE